MFKRPRPPRLDKQFNHCGVVQFTYRILDNHAFHATSGLRSDRRHLSSHVLYTDRLPSVRYRRSLLIIINSYAVLSFRPTALVIISMIRSLTRYTHNFIHQKMVDKLNM